jgi:hypothetical protein
MSSAPDRRLEPECSACARYVQQIRLIVCLMCKQAMFVAIKLRTSSNPTFGLLLYSPCKQFPSLLLVYILQVLWLLYQLLQLRAGSVVPGWQRQDGSLTAVQGLQYTAEEHCRGAVTQRRHRYAVLVGNCPSALVLFLSTRTRKVSLCWQLRCQPTAS